MDATSVAGNPFAVLTAVVAPAILTNASSVLALGTSNRLARVVDRTRFVTAQLANLDPSSSEYGAWASQLVGLRIRARLLVEALGAIYGSLGLFAAAALVSIVGSVASYYGRQYVFELAAILAMATGGSAVIGLSFGCLQMVRETRLAVRNLALEAGAASAHAASQAKPQP